MTTLAVRTIAALRAEHDGLVAALDAFTPDQLVGPSGAAEWTVAQVYSHLGSGAEIGLAGFRGQIGEGDAPGPDFNQHVWDRWNALSPDAQAAAWRESDEAWVAALEALTPEQHETIQVNPGFLPEPISLASLAGLRLNEVAFHSWDIRVAADRTAGLTSESAGLLAEHLSGGIGFLLGFIAKLDVVSEPAVVDIAGTPYRIVLGDEARLTTEPATATATFDGPLEAALRLLVGRLSPSYTPTGVKVTGNVTLDDLRAVFPGF
ncbi:maleylpyruvate isomerase family mycothiol-dependent enzyme [Actinoplanes sp. Pm04-4]|uniref:Maleylpyruvate isomerase family mycothiol-dependent enzyme n=1 Tax=Paractinoplanes pyxinae TaxID=2997416 RepID=A0ABT4BHJ0_9ACTN|nr:maleylpyruvate isomerase family mycothiol-dependent enzyme [Actinoplanes pyxinae]MCY1145065.1 maleylpyruvate isomerase family mycothiol-dependent enzyme [Actinoplanes pyxinae]